MFPSFDVNIKCQKITLKKSMKCFRMAWCEDFLARLLNILQIYLLQIEVFMDYDRNRKKILHVPADSICSWRF